MSRRKPAAWEGRAWSNSPTLLTGAVGMLLLFTYLVKAISSSSPISPTAALFVYALSSTVLLMETA